MKLIKNVTYPDALRLVQKQGYATIVDSEGDKVSISQVLKTANDSLGCIFSVNDGIIYCMVACGISCEPAYCAPTDSEMLGDHSYGGPEL